MINKIILEEKLNNTYKGIITYQSELPIQLNGYEIRKNKGEIYLGLYGPDNYVFVTDEVHYILEYSKELLDIEFNSILIGGLGLGVIPYVCQDFATIDIIEINQDIINIANQLNHLNNNVNIIQGDFTTFTPTSTYDVIVTDIWYEGLTEEQNTQIIDHYLPHVNEGGFLYIPINIYGDTSKVKIIK
jgi:hypothetical protein